MHILFLFNRYLSNIFQRLFFKVFHWQIAGKNASLASIVFNQNQDPNLPPDLDEFFGRLFGKKKPKEPQDANADSDNDKTENNEKADGNEEEENNGGNGGDSNNSNPPPHDELPPEDISLGKLISWGITFLLCIWFLSGIYTVKERENGIELFLGKYSETTKSGLNWHFPYPLGSVVKVDVQTITTMRIGEFRTQKGSISTQDQRVGQMLTKDENIVEIGAAVQYRINDAFRYQFNAADPVMVLNDIVTSAIREVVGANTVDDVLTDKRNVWPEQAKQIIVDTVNAYGLGIEIVALELQDARVPVEVQDAFEDAVRAREDEERLRLQAEAFAKERLPIARGESEQILQAANAYAARILAKANADSTRFNDIYRAYEKNKAALKDRLYLDTMTEIYRSNQKVINNSAATPIVNIAGKINTDETNKIAASGLERQKDSKNTENNANYIQQDKTANGNSVPYRSSLRNRSRN
ncbi:MAG: FtsH protease activity modulator HflK [Cardiobacteriaceae bacterium]|nr:FtsH protease activity modulator HflK [Cardiobacteriaceae bacterium]